VFAQISKKILTVPAFSGPVSIKCRERSFLILGEKEGKHRYCGKVEHGSGSRDGVFPHVLQGGLLHRFGFYRLNHRPD